LKKGPFVEGQLEAVTTSLLQIETLSFQSECREVLRSLVAILILFRPAVTPVYLTPLGTACFSAATFSHVKAIEMWSAPVRM
jgi:hypothetical protein